MCSSDLLESRKLGGKRGLILGLEARVRTWLQTWGAILTEAKSHDEVLSLANQAALNHEPFDFALLDSAAYGDHHDDGPAVGSVIFIGEAPGHCLKPPVAQQQLLEAILNLPREVDPIESRSLSERHGVTPAERRSKRLLVVEDNPVNQAVARGILKALGYAIDVATNGRQALNALKKRDYNLVFMDLQMPEMDGFEATRLIRSGEAGVLNPAVPIVAMTAHTRDIDRQNCLAAGMDDYLAKPFRPEQVAALLEIFFGKPKEA